MSTSAVAGIYMIRNKLNGKVYIGQSKNIRRRFNQYRWGANTNADYIKGANPIAKALHEEGLENFEFSILAAGPEYENRTKRQVAEITAIMEHQSDDPRYGYNQTSGGEAPLDGYARPQKLPERSRRAKSIIRYNIKTGEAMLYFGGAKAVGDDMGYGKDVMSHTVKRGSLLEDRYYLIPASKVERDSLLELLRIKKTTDRKFGKQYKSRKINSFNAYEKAVKIVDKIAQEDFGIH